MYKREETISSTSHFEEQSHFSIVKLQDSSLSLRGKCEFVCIKTREMGLNVGDEFRKRRGI